MQSRATTVAQYLRELPNDRRRALTALRKTIRANLPRGYEEGMQYGMIGYYVPHRLYPAGYHCKPEEPLPFASIASQKNHMAIYLMCIYADRELTSWFMDAWTATGKRLDMGKACIRFKRLEDVPLEVVGEAIARVPVDEYVASYEANLPPSAKRGGGKAKATTRASSKRTATRKKA